MIYFAGRNTLKEKYYLENSQMLHIKFEFICNIYKFIVYNQF
jgi:hypothetical protein